MVLEKFRVDGKGAVSTGGGRGSGRACALALSESGADIVVAARRQGTLDEICFEVQKIRSSRGGRRDGRAR